MTRDELEARIWAITGRELTGQAVDALLNLAEEYTADYQEHHPGTALHHTGGTDLWPVICVLADALLGDDGDLACAFHPDDDPATTETRAA